MKNLIFYIISAVILHAPMASAFSGSGNRQMNVYSGSSHRHHFVNVSYEAGRIYFKECFGSLKFCEPVGSALGYTPQELSSKSTGNSVSKLTRSDKTLAVGGAVLGAELAGSLAFAVATDNMPYILGFLVGIPALTIATPLIVFAGGAFCVLRWPVWVLRTLTIDLPDHIGSALRSFYTEVLLEHPVPTAITIAGAIAGSYYLPKFVNSKKSGKQEKVVDGFLKGQKEMMIDAEMGDYVKSLSVLLKH